MNIKHYKIEAASEGLPHVFERFIAQFRLGKPKQPKMRLLTTCDEFFVSSKFFFAG